MGGSGVQRTLKFVKYLREFGWNPIVLCPEPGVYHAFDSSLEEELEMLDIELYRIKASTPFHWLAPKGSSTKVTVSNNKAQFIRKLSRLIFYPDNKRGWIKPAISKAKEIINTKKVEIVFSTAPPFSNHLIGAELKKETKIPLVLDYRDSWLNNHFMTDLFGWQKKIMHTQEEFALSKADYVLGLDEFMLETIVRNHPDLKLNTKVITHGFDEEDFNKESEVSFRYKEGKLNILYSGLFYESNQPDIFLKALKTLFEREKELKNSIHLHFQGGLDKRIKGLIQSFDFESIVTNYGYVSHNEAVSNLKRADVLWMISNFSKELKQIKSGKLFEYIGSGKPILGLVHSGEASKLLDSYNVGFSAPPDNLNEIVNSLKKIITDWKERGFEKPDQEFVKNFNRRKLTEKLASVFNVISH